MRQPGAVDAAAEDSDELAAARPRRPAGVRTVALLYLPQLLIALVRTPQFQQFLVVTGLAVGGLWWCYSKLPDWLQKLIRALWRWKSHDD